MTDKYAYKIENHGSSIDSLYIFYDGNIIFPSLPCLSLDEIGKEIIIILNRAYEVGYQDRKNDGND